MATRASVGILACVLAGCATQERNQSGSLRYVGSSTIAQFIRDADAEYAAARFVIDSQPESVGGEVAIVEGRTDIGGVAGKPHAATLNLGVNATLIGRDAIAVIVHRSNAVKNLSTEQLRDIFTGKITNWRDVGGNGAPIHPYVVGHASATRQVFRSSILGEHDYNGCAVVRPDHAMPVRIANDPSGIGQISLSFISRNADVHALDVDGQPARASNPDYPIGRPLYLLWWPGRSSVANFISWTQKTEGQKVLMRRFAKPSHQ